MITCPRLTSHVPADTSAPVMETTVGGVLRAAAAAWPGRLAMVGGLPDPGMRKRWTYAQLLAQAEPAARALTARFAPGERVAVWAPNLPEWAIVEYAAALAGLVLVMVMVNPAYRPAELAYVLNQSGAVGIFLVREFRSPHGGVPGRGPAGCALPAGGRLRHRLGGLPRRRAGAGGAARGPAGRHRPDPAHLRHHRLSHLRSRVYGLEAGDTSG